MTTAYFLLRYDDWDTAKHLGDLADNLESSTNLTCIDYIHYKDDDVKPYIAE